MLTPVDQPLDKLDDLTPSEMYVHRPSYSASNLSCLFFSENMNGNLLPGASAVHIRLDANCLFV
jgi:hypothetical protein